MMRQKKIFFLIVLFTIFFAYITNIEKIPENITLYQDEEYEIGYLKGIEIDGDNIEKKNSFFNKLVTIKANILGDLKLNLSALGFFNKTITVSVLPKVEVIPGGDCIGVKLYSKGVLIIGESKIQGVDGNFYKAYEDGTFKAGDILLKIKDYEIENSNEVETIIENIKDKEVTVTYERDGEEKTKNITPIKCIDDGKYKIGLWIRDGAMGVGTLTFYSPEYSKFAALGHGISDEDSKSLIKLENGSIYGANVLSVNKGRSEAPGEIKGYLDDGEEIGTITVNSNNGIYGDMNEYNTNIITRERIPVASRNEIEVGPATIQCIVDQSQEIKSYDIEIVKISNSVSNDSKGMIIKVTDEDLISKTGGIVQGMSGSPIIQNGKLVGAVTHVYVSQPTKGYAIFADTMINEMKKG